MNALKINGDDDDGFTACSKHIRTVIQNFQTLFFISIIEFSLLELQSNKFIFCFSRGCLSTRMARDRLQLNEIGHRVL